MNEHPLHKPAPSPAAAIVPAIAASKNKPAEAWRRTKVLGLALIVPVNGGQSAARLLATAVRDCFLNFSFMVSVS